MHKVQNEKLSALGGIKSSSGSARSKAEMGLGGTMVLPEADELKGDESPYVLGLLGYFRG